MSSAALPPPPPRWAPPPPGATRQGPPAPPPHNEPDHGEQQREHHRDNSRLALILALSIALVSVLGAVVGWRAETHASRASRFEQDAVAASIASTQLEGQAQAQANDAQSSYQHYLRLGEEYQRLGGKDCTADANSDILQWEAYVACRTQIEFGGYNDPAYLGRNGTFDVTSYARDVKTLDSYTSDDNAETYIKQADTERQAEHHMLYLSLLLVLALALLTLARLGGNRIRRLILAVPGWLCLAGGAVLLIVAEM